MLGRICLGCKTLSTQSSFKIVQSWIVVRGFHGKNLKRFYKNVSISQTQDGFEVNLDQRKLKTPTGVVFRVPSEPLALMVATEWDAQHETINRHSMHLTSLCNTVIDNPTHRSDDTVINGILEFLDTDTICYHSDVPTELAELQKQEWDPLIEWVGNRYGVRIKPTTGLGVPHIPKETKDVFRQHLLSYNNWALTGYQNCVECVKSLIITSALIDRHLTVETAVDLARLEQRFQTQRWGSVEWYHDVDVLQTRARLAAATLLVHTTSEDVRTVFNKQAVNSPV
ncbi:ATP synthase mitochondrial F1 complex assembly factor 2 [Lamellibrachia satsuma]|nr:ATP synthase mitochondrial F1 complex assembly factor 2 [Lamellibrachia satsuma]